MHDARHLRALLLQIRPGVVNAAQNAGRRRQRIDARLRHRGVALPAFDDHFEVQAAVMCRGDRVRESGSDGKVRLTQPVLQDPAGADVAANLLVVGEVQFQTAVEQVPGGGGLPQNEKRIRVGREIRFADGHPAAVHRRSMDRVIDDFGAVRIFRPAPTGRYDIAVSIECNARAASAKLVPDDQVGRRDHSGGPHALLRHRMGFHCEAERGQQCAGALGMRRAVTGRIVGRDLDQLGEKPGFAGEMTVDGLRHKGIERGGRRGLAHEFGLKWVKRSVKAAAASSASASSRDSAG